MWEIVVASFQEMVKCGEWYLMEQVWKYDLDMWSRCLGFFGGVQKSERDMVVLVVQIYGPKEFIF